MLAVPGTPSIAKHEANAFTLSPGSECCLPDRNSILKTKETQTGTPGYDSGAAAQETQGQGHARWAWAWYVWPWSSHGLRALSWTCPDSHCPLLPPSQGDGEASALSTPEAPAPQLPQPRSPRKPELTGCRAANPNTGRKCLFSSPNCPSCCVVAE